MIHITDNHQGAKVAFTQECKAAGVKVNFVEPVVHVDMVRRADGSGDSSDSSHAGMAGMAGMGSAAGAATTATPTVARPAKADGSSARASGARASATSKGVKPASYTGAAVPREVAGSMLGFVAAVAAAAAI
jgi:hypothetical protein